jgi:hypothetical protein
MNVVFSKVEMDKNTLLNKYFFAPPFSMDGLTGIVEAMDVSDGHHTMEELYEHRIKLFLALLKVYDTYITPLDARGSFVRCWKSKQHEDGTMYDGWFIAGITKTIPNFDASMPPEKWDISYHIPIRFWNICSVMELAKAPHYDGYGSKDVLERLMKL